MLRLTQIELLGFKSFPHRTVVELDPSVTCIVGPNGSGKSNITDAVNFAFGSQSGRDLRTSNMAGLIFAGTDQLRALSLASVTLHFERSERERTESDGLPVYSALEGELEFGSLDSDAPRQPAPGSGGFAGARLTRHIPDIPERDGGRSAAIVALLSDLAPGERLSLTRRVFRDGTGAYFINDEPVRLRDVDELFARYNLGRNAVFSVSQGEVEKKVLETPQELREWFAEATGVGILLAHKERAQMRLKRTSANLERLEDIRGNTRELVVDLARQREKAEAHLKLKAQLRAVELNEIRREVELAQRQQESSAQALSELTGRLAEARQVLTAAQQRYEESQRERDNAERELVEALKNIETGREDAARLRQEAAVAEGALAASEQALNQARTDENDLSGQVSAVERELAANSEAVRDARQRLGELKEAEAQAGAVLKSALEQLRASEQAQEDARNRGFELAQQSAQVQNELEALSRLSGQLSADLKQREMLRSTAAQRVAELEREQQEQQRAMTALASDAERRRSELETNNRAIDELLAQIGAGEASQAEQRDSLAELGSRRRTIAELAEDSSDANAALLLEAELFPSPVSSASEVRFPVELRPAFTRLLAHVGDALVVDPQQLGAVRSALLRGRTEALLVFAGERPVLPEFAAESIWRQLDCDRRVLAALVGMLGDVALAGSMEEAERLLAGSAQFSAAVLRDGSALLNRSYAQIGNPSAERALKVAQLSDIAELDRQIEKVKGELETSGAVLRQQRGELARMQWERDEATAALAAADERLKSSRELSTRLIAGLAERQDELELLGSEASRIEEHFRKLGVDRPQLETRLREIESERGAHTRQVEELEAQRESKHNYSELARTAHSEAATQLELARQRSAHLEQAGLDLAERRANLIRRVEMLRERIGKINAQREAQIAGAADSRARAGELEQQLSMAASELDQLRARRGGMNKSVDEEQRRIVEGREALSRLEQDELTLGAQRERAIEKVSEQLELLREKYSLTLSGLLSDPAVTAPPPGSSFDASEAGRGKLREEKARLAAALDEIGAVNLLAIEQHSEHSRRLEFMDRQAIDLERAVASLRQLIEDLDDTTEQKYSSNMALISERFNDLYQELFEGGWARLSFEEPDDIINSGVEVEVQLPGGRRHSLRSLSGGQRSLIFIALFFAVHSVRSPGICVLDEADAALDDANVERFVRLLRRYSENEQVLVVTHNKHTMETADKLVGVVGRPKGVSNLLEVNLKQARGMVEKAS